MGIGRETRADADADTLESSASSWIATSFYVRVGAHGMDWDGLIVHNITHVVYSSPTQISTFIHDTITNRSCVLST
jgi:hypothetical protein